MSCKILLQNAWEPRCRFFALECVDFSLHYSANAEALIQYISYYIS